MREIFKDIKGYENLYQVSNLGRIKSLNRIIKKRTGAILFVKERILKHGLNTDGYPIVSLCNGKNLTKKIHRLEAIAFISNPNCKPQVNHKNGIRNDNNINNLEWVTNSENHIHSYKILKRKHPMKGKFGKDHHCSKAVVQYSKDDKFISEYNGQSEAARITGISDVCISGVCLGKCKTAGGFKWKFK